MVIEALSTTRSALGILLMNSIYIVQIVFQLFFELYKFVRPKEDRPASWKWLLAFLVSTILAIGSFGVIVYFTADMDPNSGWKVPLAVLLLSLAWAPVMQKLQTQRWDAEEVDEESQKDPNEADDDEDEEDEEKKFQRTRPDKDARWRSGMITSFLKLLLTPAVVTLYVYTFNIGRAEVMWSWTAWSQINMSHPAINSFLVNIFTSFGAYIFCLFACSICIYHVGFAVPLLLSTVFAYLFAFIVPVCEVFIPEEACIADTLSYSWGIPAAVCLFLAQLISVWSFLARSPTNVLEKDSKIFWLPGYNNIFLEQWLILGRKTRYNNKKQFKERTKIVKNACVYICSTMYHESEEEMEQLLLSLRGIANDLQDEAKRHFEAHVFFDGGCKQGQPSRWALQLLSLVDKTMKVSSKENVFSDGKCEKWDTPYGLQLSWRVGTRKMPFNIHLKDNSRVRAKKRWSQVMYMSYILDYLSTYNPLGMTSGAIEDDDIKASSPKKGSLFMAPTGPHRARLNSPYGWTASVDDRQPYIQVDLGETKMVTGVVTQGKPGEDQWVRSYTIQYQGKDVGSISRLGTTSVKWDSYSEGVDGETTVFNGNSDSDTPVKHYLKKPICTRYLKICPTPGDWHNACSMRLEILGYNPEDKLDNTYLLVTDADVKFNPDAAKALLDITARDPAVGAVCARTHPIGTGAVAWYQIFDYAIGHWLNKCANNVLGTVLCCPGCFSVYRAKAVRSTLPTYCTHVTKANEFLIKDMGEDRWLCTLMVENGWKLEYSAVSEDSTFCPETFDEFFKQRRRWLPSTVANLVLMIQKWQTMVKNNNNISRLFILYQLLLLFSTLIGPGTCCLLVSGGLNYAYGVNVTVTMVLLVLTSVAYAMICLYTSQNFQLQMAQVLTFVFAIVMAAVTVGTAREVVEGLSGPPPLPTDAPTVDPDTLVLPVPVSTIYFLTIIAIFIVTALLHPTEFFCLIHGIWYLFCLPSGYLLLTIYSICNLNDRSWGTREGKTVGSGKSWTEIWWSFVDAMRRCCNCGPTQEVDEPNVEEIQSEPPTPTQAKPPPSPIVEDPGEEEEGEDKPKRKKGFGAVAFSLGQLGRKGSGKAGPSARRIQKSGWFKPRTGQSLARRATRKQSAWRRSLLDTDKLSTAMWLPAEFKDRYLNSFLQHGYDDTTFIAGMSDGDLEFIGVTKIHRPALLREIDKLSEYQIDIKVPETVEEWLDMIGLEKYNDKFVYEGYDVTSLVNIEEQQIRENLGINKAAHVKRMLIALSKLRHPSELDERIDKVKKVVSKLTTQKMENVSQDHVRYRENRFWAKLRNKCIKQDYGVFSQNVGLKEQLEELRNSWLIILAVSNALWLTLILTLAQQANLQLLGTNPLGLVFLSVFGCIIVIQFLAMLVHRVWSLMHLLARVKYPWQRLEDDVTIPTPDPGADGQKSAEEKAKMMTIDETAEEEVYDNPMAETDDQPVYDDPNNL
ncbi:uncharacterized protein [Branchiostoma lanceolatum]|uniref:uncharacterized protein n=1 Tax=Branchiostoma lanceolatum TaxID=7740 RepID=UPI003453DFFD